MGIDVAGFAMRCPSGMPHPDGAVQASVRLSQRSGKIGHLADLFLDEEIYRP